MTETASNETGSRLKRVATIVYRSRATALIRPLLRRAKLSPWMPFHWLKLLRLFKILNFDYGYLRSATLEKPLDNAGNPYPWYTYSAIEYLSQLDFREKTVFEYGCGQSTLFWAKRAARVITVEHNPAWYDLLRPNLPENCTLLYEPESCAYARTIDAFGLFDVIAIDGLVTGRTRLKCARAAVAHLRTGGMIILDNADWLPESSRYLRHVGLIEVDMAGFAPINDYTCTTSLYFDRAFAINPLTGRQPVPGIGAHRYNWESGAEQERIEAEQERKRSGGWKGCEAQPITKGS